MSKVVADTISTFFNEIAARGKDPQLQSIKGTCRFDIAGVGSWYLTIDNGALEVNESKGDADLVITCDAQDFRRIIVGEEHPFIAGLQGKLVIVGKEFLFPLVQRFFPPPVPRDTGNVAPVPDHPAAPSPAISTDQAKIPQEKPPTPSQTVSILEGNTFVVSDMRGDIDARPTDTQGLFGWDTRYLSRWLLTINGITPNALSTYNLEYYSTQFFLVPTTGTVYVDTTLSVIRTREVRNGFHEDIDEEKAAARVYST